MNFREMYYFKTIAELGSVKMAADNLFISQPALSKSLKKLEEELGYTLFDRNGRRLVLNENGKVFLSLVNDILSRVDRIKDDFIAQINRSKSFVLDSRYDFISSPVFQMVADSFPDTKLTIHSHWSTAADNIQQIVKGNSDAAVTVLTDTEYRDLLPLLRTQRIHLLLISYEQLCISAPKREPFLSMDVCGIERAMDFNYVEVTDDFISRPWFEKLARQKGLRISYQYSVGSNEFLTIWNAIDKPFVTTSLYMAHKDFQEKFKHRHQIRIESPESIHGLYLMWRETDDEHINALIRCIKDHIYDIFEQSDY